MADFHRLIRSGLYFLVGVMLSAVAVLAYAETIPASSGTESAVQVWRGPRTQHTSLTAACTAYAGTTYILDSPLILTGAYDTCNGHTLYDPTVRGFANADVGWQCPSLPTTNVLWQRAPRTCTGVAYTCPTGKNWTLSGNQCTRPDCVAPQTRDPSTGVCSAPSCPDAGSSVGSSGSTYGGSGQLPGGSNICISSCTTTPKGGCWSSKHKDGHWEWGCAGPFVATGASCVSTPTVSAIPADDPRTACTVKGQAFGTVNGQVVCVPPTISSTSQTNSTTPPAGSGTGPSTTNITKNTVCNDAGSCTTTTTTTTTSGGSGPGGTGEGSTTTPPTTTEDTKPKVTFCEENPNSQFCKDSSFAGSCAAGASPACTGDAVQCAQATAAWKLQCDLSQEPKGAAYELGKTLTNGGADPVSNPLSDANTTTVDVAAIVSNAGGQRILTAQCIPAPSFSAMGHTYTLPVDLFCSFAEIVGYLMVAAASVIAIRMVVSGAS